MIYFLKLFKLFLLLNLLLVDVICQNPISVFNITSLNIPDKSPAKNTFKEAKQRNFGKTSQAKIIQTSSQQATTNTPITTFAPRATKKSLDEIRGSSRIHPKGPSKNETTSASKKILPGSNKGSFNTLKNILRSNSTNLPSNLNNDNDDRITGISNQGKGFDVFRNWRKNYPPLPGMIGGDENTVQADPPLDIIRNSSFKSRHSLPLPEVEDILGVKCNFETECAWKWTPNQPNSFRVTSGSELSTSNLTGIIPGPKADPLNNATGKFLYAKINESTTITLTSPEFSNTLENCRLELFMHQSAMIKGLSRIVIEPLNNDEPWVPSEIQGNNLNMWEPKYYRIGQISRDFKIVLEIVPQNVSHYRKAHVAIDNIRMGGCFKESAKNRNCSTLQLRCQMNKVPVCMDMESICDIDRDCDDNEDEVLNCDKIPFGARCDFETDLCGWQNGTKTMLHWTRHTGPSPTDRTGPDCDHTYQHLNNVSGYYMLVNMNQHSGDETMRKNVGFASNAIMNSKIFNPPPSVHGNPHSPYRNSCMVRFSVHQFGLNPGSVNFSVVELKEKENVTSTLWWSTKNLGNMWHRQVHVLPNVTTKYFLQFEARMGMRIFSDVAVDDISLSPECFGINIPEDQLKGYNYWDPRIVVKKETHRDFYNKNFLELGTCGARGIQGPTPNLCETAYREINNSQVLNTVKILDKDNYKGMQKWKVPNEGYYTIISKGAGGGLGTSGVGSSRGAMAISVLELHKNEELYILVGQKGEDACIKSFGYKEEGCETSGKGLDYIDYTSKTHMVKNFIIDSAAGGGGGGSYVFLINSANRDSIPLVVAGGGGGLGVGRFLDEDFQHGQRANPMRLNVTGIVHFSDEGNIGNNRTAGPGGGWKARDDAALSPTFGASVLEGGRGGLACYATTNSKNYHGQGGFGGGGGGCNTGGGGGGFSGGDTYDHAPIGEGGTSFISFKRSLKDFNIIYEGANSGPGSVIIIPAIEGCGCDYRCIALDEYRSTVRCICPDKWRLKRDNHTACEMISDEEVPFEFIIIFFCIITLSLICALTFLIFMLYNRYQRKKQAAERHKMLQDQDLQLSRLRNNADDSALTNFNPNYGCDGILNGTIDVEKLPQVARESLRLVKALGQGAFGEVYQGLYRHRDGDAVEMPVAVKTLPSLSTGQAEADFLMEAAIMAKFNHPNIVHLIGVCFDRHPRFIVLELLAGGDLKNFLREGRDKPERPSVLTMKDLVFCAIDVAKGCHYMESKRFIHRDIAARNCLLSSKGPGRVVKIADFGMARDIYRSDYYRKGGKAMLPIKWMPPEAFLDGIFTSKTDVWSFGVLLWEVFSLGLMPYTGLPNRDVLTLVTGGGRLDAPPGCPPVIYLMMAECWNPTPEERPSFSKLLERLTACTQDPEVMNAPLPRIMRPQSNERDQTVMRPPGNDEFCLQIPNSSDYLIPLPGPRTAERLLSEGTGITIPDTMTTYTAPTITSPSIPNPQPIYYHSDENCSIEDNNWGETSFIMPSTKSTEALLQQNDSNCILNGIDINCLEEELNGNMTILPPPPEMNGGDDDDETRLISLDTPQPTPTAIKPPMSFAQLDGITLDPSALANTKSQHNSNGSTNKPQAYANVQMMKKSSELNGGLPNGTNNLNGIGNGTSSSNGSSSTLSTNSAPYTISKGYKDRYNNKKDKHSEISC